MHSLAESEVVQGGKTLSTEPDITFVCVCVCDLQLFLSCFQKVKYHVVARLLSHTSAFNFLF